MRRALVPIIVLIAAMGCWNPFASDERITLEVSDVTVPAELAPGTTLVVALTVVTGGCRSFERIQAERSAARLVLTARGRDGERPGRACTADIRYEARSYQAAPPFADPFTIVVRQPDGSELTREVRIR